jgi:hypothetical protein
MSVGEADDGHGGDCLHACHHATAIVWNDQLDNGELQVQAGQ